MDLLTLFSSAVGGMAPTERCHCVIPIPRNYIENSLRKLGKQFERDPTIGSIVMDLLIRFCSAVGRMAPTGNRQHVVPIPRNSIENSLRKLMKKF